METEKSKAYSKDVTVLNYLTDLLKVKWFWCNKWETVEPIAIKDVVKKNTQNIWTVYISAHK